MSEDTDKERSIIPLPERAISIRSASLAKRGVHLLEALSAPLALPTPQLIGEADGAVAAVVAPGDHAYVRLAPGVEMEFVRVPAGEFLMGSDTKDPDARDAELPQHKVYLDEYWMGKYPVTVAQFAVFVQASGHQTTAERVGYGLVWTGDNWERMEGADWQRPRGPESDVTDKGSHPVTQVSWHDATAFCEWASQVADVPIRLPTEAEWEKGARGTDGRKYPWGEMKPDKSRCNFGWNVKDTTPVGRYSPKGDSPYGCTDMAGNVWEWVANKVGWFGEDYASSPR